MTKKGKSKPRTKEREVETPRERSQALVPPIEGIALQPVISLQEAKFSLHELHQFVQFYLIKGKDYGTIPGTAKPTLYKSGGDKLCDIYGLTDDYEVIHRTEEWEADPALFAYDIKCVLTKKLDGSRVSTALGSCTSYESKYRYREELRSCPTCAAPAVVFSKRYGNRWFCLSKKGGCNARFAANDARLVTQQLRKIPNPDIASTRNTILKMAKKRAKLDAVLAATRSSGIFTQDIEDTVEPPDDYIDAEFEEINEPQRASKTHNAHKKAPPARKTMTGKKIEFTKFDGKISLWGDGTELLAEFMRDFMGGKFDEATGVWILAGTELGNLSVECERRGIELFKKA